MSLPYRWTPDGADRHILIDKIEPGMILAKDHAVWRVIKVHRKPEDEQYPWRIILRPIEITGDDPRDRDHDQAYKVTEGWRCFTFADLHYPICAKCLEPLPCREQMVARVTEAESETFEQYSAAGVCPACSEPVTTRQKCITWQENLVVPLGPPVTFHMRRQCRYAAIQYEGRWYADDPTRTRVLSCDGNLTVHYNDARECTQRDCPGGQAHHRSYVRHFPGYIDCTCVAGIPLRTAPAPQQPPAEVQRFFEDQT